MPRSRPRWLPHPAWLTASLVLAFALIVPTAYMAMPSLHRWHALNQLTSTDLAARERALNYVIRHAGDDPAVRAGALDRLSRLDPIERREAFNQIANALDHAGVWSRRYVPNATWITWVGLLSTAPEFTARRAAAQHLAELTDLADEHDVWIHLLGLMSDEDEPAVRHDALRTAMLLTAHTDPTRIDAASFMHAMLRDRVPGIARDTWLAFGLMRQPIDQQANWRNAPPPLAEAILWAAVQTNPQHPQPAIDALHDTHADHTARAMAAYALHLSDTDAARRALFDQLAQRPLPREPGPARATLQRTILAAPLPNSESDTDTPPHEGTHLLDELCDEIEALAAEGETVMHPLATACHFRAPPSIRQDIDRRLEHFHDQPARALALVEGLPVGSLDIPVTLAHPAMIRLAATARTRQPRIDLIEDLFSHEQSTLRDLACIVARDRLDDDQLSELVWSLLTDLNPEARISGAIVSGLTGLHTDLVRERAADERTWRMQTLMRVGLWMQGAEADTGADTGTDAAMSSRMTGLLTRDDLPMSTLLLALMHRRDARGLDFLLAPHGDPAPDLHRLLVHYRWWHVLARHLSDDAPPLWLWGDPGLHRFQIDVLRNWYRLHRHELTEAPRHH